MYITIIIGKDGKEHSFKEKAASAGCTEGEIQSGGEEEMLGPPAEETEGEDGRYGQRGSSSG